MTSITPAQLCWIFKDRASVVFKFIEQSHRVGLGVGEETITDVNLFEINQRLPAGHSRHEEVYEEGGRRRFRSRLAVDDEVDEPEDEPDDFLRHPESLIRSEMPEIANLALHDQPVRRPPVAGVTVISSEPLNNLARHQD